MTNDVSRDPELSRAHTSGMEPYLADDLDATGVRYFQEWSAYLQETVGVGASQFALLCDVSIQGFARLWIGTDTGVLLCTQINMEFDDLELILRALAQSELQVRQVDTLPPELSFAREVEGEDEMGRFREQVWRDPGDFGGIKWDAEEGVWLVSREFMARVEQNRGRAVAGPSLTVSYEVDFGEED